MSINFDVQIYRSQFNQQNLGHSSAKKGANVASIL